MQTININDTPSVLNQDEVALNGCSLASGTYEKMKTLATIRTLFREAKNSFDYGDKQVARVFYTLLSLYIKSKLSRKDDRVVSHRIDGFTVCAYDYPTLIELYREVFLKATYYFEMKEAKPLIIDCGANIGMSVLFFKKCYPECEVWAFEPNPNSFLLLEKNIKENRIENVKLFPFALSDTDESIDFYVPFKKGSLNGSSFEGLTSSEKINVEARKLSRLIKDRNPACVKIDVEGDEEKIIWDLADNHLLESIDCLLVEYHRLPDRSPQSLSRFKLYVENAGFICDTQSYEEDKVGDFVLRLIKKKPVPIRSAQAVY